MARYISRLFIVVEAKNEAEACDAMSACLSENLKYGGHIVDWSYATSDPVDAGSVYDGPRQLSQEAPDDIEDFDDFEALFAGRRPSELTLGSLSAWPKSAEG